MLDRRQFLHATGAIACAASPLAAFADEVSQLPRRPLPGGDASLPIVGLGNSNAFRQGDMETSARVIGTLAEHGGAYIDCNGSSRFVVGRTVADLGLVDEMFLGTYFTGADDETARDDAAQLLEMTGKPRLDLMHNYPEDAAPNWSTFRAWKDDGLTKFIGVSRHRKEAYPTMMKMMETGTVDIVQVNYSLLEPEAEDSILPLAMDKGIAVTVNRPFINGRYFQVVSGHELPEWAAEFDCNSWAQFSLKFILSHPAVTCVLTETTNPKHVLDNIGGGLGRMPDAATRQRMREHMQSIAA